MTVRNARERSLRCRLLRGASRAAQISGLAASLVFIATEGLQTAAAEGDTRTLSFHHVHTKEDITVTFKKNGRYDEAALAKLNWFMRDWRKDEQTRMDPQLFDVLWEAYRSVNAKQPIHIICGYRSQDTNSMLRARSSGVAQLSLHTQGDAMDFFIPGVPLEEIRNVGLRLQRGGVGFYPSSGSPFVHLDTGSIRHWPRMSHDALARVFPDGKTVHVPSDGQPLAGYALALAEVERNGRAPSNVSLAAARDTGVIETDREPATPQTNTALASFFGFGAKPEAKSESKPEPTKMPPAPKPVQVAAAPIAVAVEHIVPVPKHRPAEPVQVAQANIPTPASRPSFALAAVETTALAPLEEPAVTAGTQLAYAPEAVVEPVRRVAKPMNVTTNVPMGAMTLKPTLAAERPAPAPVFASAKNAALNNPWMRALVLTPSVAHMSTVRSGAIDVAPIREHMIKPASTVTMAFSHAPQGDLRANAFTGSAIVFVATTKFVPVQRTASLQ